MQKPAACAVALLACYLIPTSALSYGGAHSGMVHIFAGPRASQTCVLMADARIACTQIGFWPFFPFNVAGKDVVKVATGSSFGCALTADSRVFCWGDNSYGKLGSAGSHDDAEPVQLNGLDFDNVVDLAAGLDHACAIRSDGTAWCWGANIFGQLGNYKLGVGSSTNVPTQVILHDGSDTPLTNLKAISAGSVQTCAMFTNNTGACWGNDYDGELANGSIAPGPYLNYSYDSPLTILVEGLRGLEPLVMGGGVISVGGGHACSLIDDKPANSIGCWGLNSHGQLGVNDKRNRVTAYSALDEHGKITDAIAVSSGHYFTCAILHDLTVRCWGSNGDYQIGGPDPSQDYTAGSAIRDATRTQLLGGAMDIAASDAGACVLLNGNAIYCWGYYAPPDLSLDFPEQIRVDAPLFTDNFDGN